MDPEFISHFNVKTNMVDNVWDFSKFKQEDKDTPLDLMLEVSKLINNVSSTAASFLIPDQDAYTKDDVNKLVIDSNKGHIKPFDKK